MESEAFFIKLHRTDGNPGPTAASPCIWIFNALKSIDKV